MSTKKTKDELEKIVQDLKDKGLVGKPILVKGLTLSFNHLTAPSTTGTFPSNKYELNATVLKEDSAGIEALQAALQKVSDVAQGEKDSDVSLICSSITDLDEKLVDETDEKAKYNKYSEGRYRVRAKSKKKPELIARDGKTPLTPEQEAGIKMGDLVNAVVNIWPFVLEEDVMVETVDPKTKKVTKKKRKENNIKLTLGLTVVQLVASGSGASVAESVELLPNEETITGDDYEEVAVEDDEF